MIVQQTVFHNIFTSNLKLHSLIYCVSSFTTSSKSVILLLPLTCHIPVRPGLKDILALWCGSYNSHSSTVGGLVPTRLISPSRILINCGNSSRLVFLINCPIPVFLVPSGRILFPMILGSKSILNISPSLILFCAISSFFRSSASIYMLRNLYILNFLPFRPILSCAKKIGPGELM